MQICLIIFAIICLLFAIVNGIKEIITYNRILKQIDNIIIELEKIVGGQK